MNLKCCTATLLGGLLLLPIAMLVTLAVGQLLSKLGDVEGGRWLVRLAAVEGIGWLMSIVGLLTATAAGSLGCCRDAENRSDQNKCC